MLQEAIILAGGLGTRLKEVVPDLPKPMALVNGAPFLNYQLKYLAHFGIKKMVLSVGHLAEKIEAHYHTNFLGTEIIYSHEKESLGTGGGIRLAMEKCMDVEVLVLNGDSFFDIDLLSFYNKHNDAISDCSLALHKVENASRYGTIKLGEFNVITSFAEKNTLQKKAGLINAGIYILNKEMFLSETPQHKNFSIEKDFFEKKVSKQNMYGFSYDNYFIDIGIPEDYKQAQHDFAKFKY